MPLEPGQQRTSLLNIVQFMVAKPRSMGVLARKIVKRATNRRSTAALTDYFAWLESVNIDSAELACRLDRTLWDEALGFGEQLRERSSRVLSEVPFDMGAGGNYEFLYWLTRYLHPAFVVETGVSAGWSSEAFLTAMARNDHGALYSSDFPYFRVRNPERYIGVLVSESLRHRWRLSTDGDENARRRIVSEVPQIDLLHYDSDKTYSGRDFGVRLVAQHRSNDAVILVDDIRDDTWFRDFALASSWTHAVLDGRCGLLDPSGRLLNDRS
jgi:predicted O-methyltransferase YrrM